MNWVNLIIFISVAVVMSGMILAIILLAFKNRKLYKQSVQAELDKFFVLTQLDKIIQESDNKKVEESEGFLKFISESRDWAFDYIENIQTALNEYDSALHTDDAKIINDAYKKLIDFLPKSEDMVN